METREQMEERLRMEAEIRKEIEAEQAAEAKKKKRKKTARNYFIGLGIVFLFLKGVEWILNWLDPGSISMSEPFVLYFILPMVFIGYTIGFFFIKEVYFTFD